MKVVFYTQVFAPSVGGVETLVGTLVRAMAEHPQSQIRPVVVTPTPAKGNQDSALPFPVVRKPGMGQLFQLFRQSEVIHLAGPSFMPLLLALLLRKKVILSHHGFQAVCPNGQLFFEPQRVPCPGHFAAGRHERCWECNKSRGLHQSLWLWFSTFFRRRLAQRASANIVPTRALGEVLQLPRTKVIPHGVPEAACTSVEEKQNTISFLGRLVSSKGAHILLQAAAELHKRGATFCLQVIGDGPERAALEQQARRAGLNGCVAFRGLLADSELDTALVGSIVVVPSLGGEVFGLVAAQNLMAGRAVVASDLDPLAEVVGDAGLVFPPGNATALADCLERLLGNPATTSRLGTQGRRRARSLFAIEQMTRSHIELYLSRDS